MLDSHSVQLAHCSMCCLSTHTTAEETKLTAAWFAPGFWNSDSRLHICRYACSCGCHTNAMEAQHCACFCGAVLLLLLLLLRHYCCLVI